MLASDFRAEARENLKGKWGKAVGIAILYSILLGIIGMFEVINIIIEIPIVFGLAMSYLKIFKGEDVEATDFLDDGFKNFKRSWAVKFRVILKVIVPIILMAISLLFILICSIAIIRTKSAGGNLVIMLGLISLVAFFACTIWATMKSYYYELAQFIAIENLEMTAKEAVQRSEELMKNRRGKLFCLQLSFIGWWILAILSLGIGLFWLIPYIQCSRVSFYKNVLSEKK